MEAIITWAKENYDLISLGFGVLGVLIGIISVIQARKEAKQAKKDKKNKTKQRMVEWKKMSPTSSPVSSLNPDSRLYTNNDNIVELVRVVGNEEMCIKQMMEKKVLKTGEIFWIITLNQP